MSPTPLRDLAAQQEYFFSEGWTAEHTWLVVGIVVAVLLAWVVDSLRGR